MSAVPDKLRIFHICHVDNLPSIVADGHLWPDSRMHTKADTTIIGMPSIKRKRLELPVGCHNGLHVGECVPFYFCPRSVMLYIISRGNHPNLQYAGGQKPIVHLGAFLHEAIAWAETNGQRWAFSPTNAGSAYTEFHTGTQHLDRVDWSAVNARNWRASEIKEHKQAEFLMEGRFPWHLIRAIGVMTQDMVSPIHMAMHNAIHRPQILIRPDWYY